MTLTTFGTPSQAWARRGSLVIGWEGGVYVLRGEVFYLSRSSGYLRVPTANRP